MSEWRACCEGGGDGGAVGGGAGVSGAGGAWRERR